MNDLDDEELKATRLLKNIDEKELDEMIKSTEGSIEETCKFLKSTDVEIVQEKSADEMFVELGYCERTNAIGQTYIYDFLKNNFIENNKRNILL